MVKTQGSHRLKVQHHCLRGRVSEKGPTFYQTANTLPTTYSDLSAVRYNRSGSANRAEQQWGTVCWSLSDMDLMKKKKKWLLSLMELITQLRGN